MSRLTRRFIVLNLYLLLVAMLGSTTLLVIAYLVAIHRMRAHVRREMIASGMA